MPKLGMQPIRRDALVKAAIAEIGRTGSLDVTVSQIARRAGVSAALAHHYFGGKDQILDAAMRHILALYGQDVRAALARAKGPHARLEAILHASFAPANFRAEVVSAWLTFYVRAQTSPGAHRLLAIYQGRLRANLMHDLRPLVGDSARAVADTVAALIDGLYIRAALTTDRLDAGAAAETALAVLHRLLPAPRTDHGTNKRNR